MAFVRIDPKIWRVIAGPCSEFPTENSIVYYFPQGLEEASAPLPIDLSRLITRNPYILCKVTAVSYLANPSTDEVTANLNLTPLTSTDSFNPLPVPDDNNNDRIISYVKVLQSFEVPPFPGGPGSSCSVPDTLAESILPPINTQSEVLQYHTVTVTDLMGREWDLVHYYNSKAKSPQKHIIIQGWGKFATDKKLHAGDGIVFIKKDSAPGKIFVGIRRVYKGKVYPRTVAYAIELAMNCFPFKVVYTPSPGTGWCDFVVRSHIVDESMSGSWWESQRRVMMAVEISVFSDVTLIDGTIKGAYKSRDPNLPTSPFRVFRIEWDQPGITSLQRVSPWQLRPISRVLSSSGSH